ncbi:acetyl-CoA carboxylase biotin carboxyl carrier protein [Anaerotignum sp.]
MDTNKINELAKILRQNQLTKLDLTEGDNRIVLEAAGGRPVAAEAPVFVPVETAVELPVEAAPEKTETADGVEQKSPLVGTVYLAPQAGAEPFVKVGDKVQKGDVLCIVESMKMFNNIEAELEGTIEVVCVDNGQIVEFGQPLFRILPV